MLIPIFCRYLLRGYLSVFLISVCTFVSVLIVSRFKEIARFAALSGDWSKTALFLLYQIPFVFPLAIPISALVAAFLLFQRLSRNYELVAFRASGMSFRTLLGPILIAATLFALLNFTFCSSVAPFCWRESKTLLYRETSANPLLLMQRQNLVKIKGAYLKMDVKREGNEADDFILITHNPKSKRLNLISARHLKIAKSKLFGYGMAILSHLPKIGSFDSLLIENEGEMATNALALSEALKKNRPRLEANALTLRQLCMKSSGVGKHAPRARVEILRRISVSIAVFTFTLLGCAFGMEAGRSPSKKGAIFALLLALPVLMSYLGLKTLKTHSTLALCFAFLPHVCIVLASLYRFTHIARGKRC
jgi:lipopolysaccharide export system permease protein